MRGNKLERQKKRKAERMRNRWREGENKKIQKSAGKRTCSVAGREWKLCEYLVKPTHKVKVRPQKNRKVIKSSFYFLYSQKKLIFNFFNQLALFSFAFYRLTSLYSFTRKRTSRNVACNTWFHLAFFVVVSSVLLHKLINSLFDSQVLIP